MLPYLPPDAAGPGGASRQIMSSVKGGSGARWAARDRAWLPSVSDTSSTWSPGSQRATSSSARTAWPRASGARGEQLPADRAAGSGSGADRAGVHEDPLGDRGPLRPDLEGPLPARHSAISRATSSGRVPDRPHSMRWSRWATGVALAAPLALAGCNAYPRYGAHSGATSQGQDTFKLYSGMMTTGVIIGGPVALLI